MATFNGELKKYSTGDDVRALQQALNDAGGYGLAIDGSFGGKTQTALKQYQQANGLNVTGVFDQATADKLYAPPPERPEGYNAATWTGDYQTFIPQAYNGKNDPDYIAAQQKVDDYRENNKPADYVSKYDAQIDQLFAQIMNRDSFKYDLNSDALYQQYRDQYIAGGQRAMQDTMGQAAALTGGYGNTYAQAAGQQQYDAYLQRLNDVIPELYQNAFDQYNAEGDRLKDLYSMQVAQEARDYDRYNDDINMYWNQLDRLQGEADRLYGMGYQYAKDQAGYVDDLANRYINLLANGISVPDEELAKAGISDAEKQLIREQYLAGLRKGGGGGGGGGDDKGPTVDQINFANTLDMNFEKNFMQATDGAGDPAAMSGLLDKYVAGGQINEQQAAALANKYKLPL